MFDIAALEVQQAPQNNAWSEWSSLADSYLLKGDTGAAQSKPLLVIAEDIEGEALATTNDQSTAIRTMKSRLGHTLVETDTVTPVNDLLNDKHTKTVDWGDRNPANEPVRDFTSDNRRGVAMGLLLPAVNAAREAAR